MDQNVDIVLLEMLLDFNHLTGTWSPPVNIYENLKTIPAQF